MRYTATITGLSDGFDLAFIAPNDNNAKATAALMASALQEPKNRGCHRRLEMAIGEDGAKLIRKHRRVVGKDFSIKLTGMLGQHIETFDSMARVQRLYPNWRNLPKLGSTDMDQLAQMVQ
jgi:hypothetical protein